MEKTGINIKLEPNLWGRVTAGILQLAHLDGTTERIARFTHIKVSIDGGAEVDATLDTPVFVPCDPGTHKVTAYVHFPMQPWEATAKVWNAASTTVDVPPGSVVQLAYHMKDVTLPLPGWNATLEAVP